MIQSEDSGITPEQVCQATLDLLLRVTFLVVTWFENLCASSVIFVPLWWCSPTKIHH